MRELAIVKECFSIEMISMKTQNKMKLATIIRTTKEKKMNMNLHGWHIEETGSTKNVGKRHENITVKAPGVIEHPDCIST